MGVFIALLMALAVSLSVQVYAPTAGGDPYPPRQDHVAGAVQHSGHN